MTSKNELVELTSNLVRFESTKENKSEIKKCLEYVKKYFSSQDFVIQEFSNEGFDSIIIFYKGNETNKTPKILLNGHIDVVEGEKSQFNPEIIGDKLLGRGSVDMKAGVAGFMKLMKDFSEEKPDMALMIVTDEEIGGQNCSGYLAKLGYSGEIVVASEPNKSKDAAHLDVLIKHKGVIWLKIFAKGKATHASLPWTGENAIEKLIEAYPKIKNLFDETTPENRWVPTLNIGKINGGNSSNVVPDYAEMFLDIRYTENFNSDEFIQKIKTFGDIEIDVLENDPLLINDCDNKNIVLLKECVEKITNNECLLNTFHGATDMRFFSNKENAAIVFGPYGENYHGKNEYVSIKSLELFYDSMKEFIKKVFN